MKANWSLQHELCSIAREETFGAALVTLGLLSTTTDTPEITVVNDWHRSGAETYSYVFTVHGQKSDEKHVRIKACTPASTAIPIERLIEKWVSRRSHLASNGISTPKLYGFGKGLIVEEEIPYRFSNVLNDLDDDIASNLLLQLVFVLIRLHYNPVTIFSDLRSRGADCVFVDFGEDLGSSGCSIVEADRIVNQLTEEIRRLGNASLVHKLEDAKPLALALAATNVQ